MLTQIDYLAIVVYAVAVLLIGYISGRKQTAEGYLISDRKLGIINSVATINASKTGAIILVFTVGVYEYGLAALWYFIGVLLGYATFIPFAVHLHKCSDGKYYTMAEYFRKNYGRISGIGATFGTLSAQIGFLSVNLIASAKVLSFFSPLNFTWSAIFVMSIVLIYILISGFKAVVRTDTFQYLAILFILIAFMFPLSQGTKIPAENWDLFGSGPVNVLIFLALGLLIPFGQPELWQRIYAMPSVKRVKQAFIYSIIGFIPVIIALTGIALLIKTKLPNIEPDIALIHGLANLLPTGMSGLAVVVFFACFMSSIDTYTYTSASSIVKDIFGQSDKKKAVAQIRLVTIPLMIFATTISIIVQDLMNATFIFVGTYLVVAIPAVASYIKKSVKPTTLATSFVVGITTLIIVVAFGLLNQDLDPMLVPKVLAGSLLGLFIGGFASWIKKKKVV